MSRWQQNGGATGRLALLLLCVLLPCVVGCRQAQAGRASPSPTAGWTTYRDARYGFQVPVAPGWQAEPQSTDGCESAGGCDYQVAFFPPDGQGRLPVSEQIYIRVVVGAQEWKPDAGPYFTRDAHGMAVGAKSVPLYDYDAGGSIQRAAVDRSGARQFIFGAQAPEARAQRDLAIYARMLREFSYSGATP